MTENIDITCYTKAELKSLYQDPLWWDQPGLPFGRARLSCYLDNPRAEEDDVLWLIAWRDGRILAYLGLVPDLINTEAQPRKIAWFSSWWADPEIRGTGLAERLTSQGLTLYPGIGIDSGTPWSMRKMKQSGDFYCYTHRPRSFWILNLNPKTIKDFGYDSRLTRIMYPCLHSILGILINMRLRIWLSGKDKRKLRVVYLAEPDNETLEFIRGCERSELCVRDTDFLKWRVELPKLMANPSGLPQGASYFGNVGRVVRSSLIKLFHGNELVAVVNYCYADGYLKLPYLYLRQEFETDFAVWIGKLCLRQNIDVIYSQDDRVKDILARSFLPHWLLKSYPMEVLLSNSLKDISPGYTLQDGDGAF